MQKAPMHVKVIPYGSVVASAAEGVIRPKSERHVDTFRNDERARGFAEDIATTYLGKPEGGWSWDWKPDIPEKKPRKIHWHTIPCERIGMRNKAAFRTTDTKRDVTCISCRRTKEFAEA